MFNLVQFTYSLVGNIAIRITSLHLASGIRKDAQYKHRVTFNVSACWKAKRKKGGKRGYQEDYLNKHEFSDRFLVCFKRFIWSLDVRNSR